MLMIGGEGEANVAWMGAGSWQGEYLKWQYQRIYILCEWTATSFVFNKVPIFPRKQEAVRKTTPELLSAEWLTIFTGGH